LNSRNQCLDMLRGIAILLVLGAHSFWPYVGWWRMVGGSGVPLFFVLSGFLISGLLFSEYQKNGRIDVLRFWIRRGFKIYPGFYVLLACTVAIRTILRPGAVFPMKSALLTAAFLQNYFQSALLFIPQSWSLAVEEHFYLALPLLLVVLIRAKSLRFIPWVTLSAIAFCTYLRMHSDTLVWRESHISMDALLVGVTIGYLKFFAPRYFPQRSRIEWLLISAVLVLPVFVLCQSRPIGPVETAIQFVGFAALLLWAAPRAASSKAPVRFMAWVGRYSYSIYLWHMVALITIALFGNTLFALLSYLALALALGIGMAKLVEFPALRLRERIVPSGRRDRVEVSAVAAAF